MNERFLVRMRAAALIAVVCGAAGSVVLMLRAGQRSPTLLIVLFLGWVLSPFVLLVIADAASKRWSALTRLALYAAMLVVAVGSLAVYADDARGHRRPQAAFVYVAVPPASWLLLAAVVPIAAAMSRRSSHTSDGQRATPPDSNGSSR
jgi:hypothetical protein